MKRSEYVADLERSMGAVAALAAADSAEKAGVIWEPEDKEAWPAWSRRGRLERLRLNCPDGPKKGRLYWLRLDELPEGPRVVVRVFAALKHDRVEAEIVGSDGTLLTLPAARLLEEI